MAQMASLLAVATVFIIGLRTLISIFYSRRREAFTRDKTTYVGTWAKSAGGLMREEGVIAGFYGIHATVTSC
jgi:hypothetical protein